MTVIPLAGCVIRNDQKHILLLHRNTPELKQWEIPGGKLEQGEDAATAAIREVKEELGVDVAIGSFLGKKSFVDNGNTWMYHWFLAEIIQGKPEPREEIHDHCKFLTLEEIKNLGDELSINGKNLIQEIAGGHIVFC